MKQQIKQFILGMVSLTAVNASAWEVVRESANDTPVTVIKKVEGIISPEHVAATTIDAARVEIKSEELINNNVNRFSPGHRRIHHFQVIEPQKINAAGIKWSQWATVYLDFDGNPKTAEGLMEVRTRCPDINLNIFNLTNGTKTTVGELRKLATHCENGNCACGHDYWIVHREKVQKMQ